MSVAWTITGQAGKAVDETAHSLEDLQAQGAFVEFNSLAADTLTWVVWLKDMNDGAGKVPELGQTITLRRNGERYFSGLVTGRDPDFSAVDFGYRIKVENAWWWINQLFLSDEVEDQAGDGSERTAYVFPTGSPRVHLMALIERAIDQGAPISEGSIASCFAVPRLSLRNIPISEAVSEAMRWIADGIVYFDYAAEGHPALSMQRRDAAAVVTLTPANGTVPRIQLKPRLDLKVEETKVFYAARATVDDKRVTIWQAQTAGAAVSGLPARQPVLVSGPEKVWDVLPQDFTDSVVVRSSLLLDGSQVKGAVFEKYDERLRAAAASGFQVGTFTENTFGGGTFTLPAVATRIVDRDGEAVPLAFNRYLTTGEIRDWWTKDGIEHVEARITGTISNKVISPTPVPSGYSATAPAWFEVMGGQHHFFNRSVPGGGFQRVDVYSTTVSVVVPLVKTAWDVETTLIRAEDYAFVNPPAGLAANLLATQNWLPFEGAADYVIDEIPAGHHVGKALNIAGFVPETANMKALITRHGVRLATGQNFLRLGAPDRLAYRDLVNRFRQNGVDNIVWLVDAVSGDPGENPDPDPELEVPVGPANAITFNGQALTYSGEYLTFDPALTGETFLRPDGESGFLRPDGESGFNRPDPDPEP